MLRMAKPYPVSILVRSSNFPNFLAAIAKVCPIKKGGRSKKRINPSYRPSYWGFVTILKEHVYGSFKFFR
jgi:hypothetical protein